MNKTVNSKISLGALAVMLIFGVIASAPQITSAYYSGSYVGNRYGYDTYTSPTIVRPVYISQPVYYTQPVVVQQPVYVSQPVVQYQPLTSSCSASVSYNINGQATVVYTANPSGGNGYYSYSWTGTEDFSGSYRSVSKTYYTSGYKYASVTVSSNGYTTTVSCNPVNITFPYNTYYQPYQQTVYQNTVQPVYLNSNNNLDVGCFVDPTNAKINQPINWTAEVSGGVAPYTYSWTGSDGLTGTQSSVIKYYSTAGSKSAIVSVTSADGKTITKACSNTITIASAYKAPVVAKATKTAPVATVSQSAVSSQPVVTTSAPINSNPTNSNLTANSMLSLANVPWGWVAVLIIMVLFLTVMYLLFNKKKI